MPRTCLIFALLLALLGCAKSPDDGNTPTPTAPITTPTGLGKGQPGTVGLAGIDAWDKLATAEKDRINGWRVLFLHQSVGQDLEEGSRANGYRFTYYGPDGKLSDGLNGGIFVDVGGIANGNPADKIRVFNDHALRNKATLQIAVFKFGYADIRDDNREAVKTAYKAFIDALRAQIPGLRFVHITPPLVYDTSADGGNAAKLTVGQWMKTTFGPTDVIFDLQAIETNENACQQGGVARICQDNRASATDPSEVNGVDSDGQGHLGKRASQRISKALLLSIYQAGK